ncbi:MAG: NADH-quinone oxidoreductase subunit J [Alphaproteobacteria bacterium]|nr:NADH-quinone oxidoreductase subunit J [Alphaproteobacteria bacterium SS10]
MTLSALAFYLFAGITCLSGLAVITSRNPVHSVFFLILAFFNAAGLFVLMGAEFVALILVIVYVGAVAVLFLFVVMMLDINFEELRTGMRRYLMIGGGVGVIFLAELIFVFGADLSGATVNQATPDGARSNTHALGEVLYTDYLMIFQVSGLILLVAMIGAIVLTLRSRPGVRKQKVDEQVARRPDDVVMVRKVPSRTGI